MYPLVTINITKIKHNTCVLMELCKKNNISVTGVTKVIAADNRITEALISGGINFLGDSRIQNLKNLQHYNLNKFLLRIPMQSEVTDVIKFSDISLNSDIETIKKLDIAAKVLGKRHGIILMIDLGDLREGIMFTNKELIFEFVKTVLDSDFLDFEGIGTNLACFGGVLASDKNMKKLISISYSISQHFDIDINFISGGNSASINLVNSLPKEINNLRLGESIVLGRETAFGKQIPNTYKDAFVLKAEIIELYQKPSVPIGNISLNAFGETPVFEDKGSVTKALLGIGRQDMNPDSLSPTDKNIEIIGASSDHLVLEIKNNEYKVGDIIEFTLNYESILRIMTSCYVEKEYIY